MKNRCILGLLFILVMAAHRAAGQPLPNDKPAPQQSAPLTTPYKPDTETVLITDGQPQATVLIPEDDRYAAVAREFVSRFKKEVGVRLPTLGEAELLKRRPKARSLVVFGNFATGPLALRLYANKLICCDGVYPGATGFELRTIPAALDVGAHILFFGGSSPAGVRNAVDSFFTELKSGRPVLERSEGTVSVPRLIRWKCATNPAPEPISDAEIEKRVAAARSDLTAFRSGAFRAVCARLPAAATNYYLSGHDSWGRLYARLVELLAKHYADRKPKPPTFILAGLVMALDQVEESAGLTDADRLRAAEWLRQMVEDTMAFWEMRDPVRRYMNQELRPIWNHETFPAMGIAHAAQYLKAHYHVPAADYWEAVVQNLFAGQITCDQPLEDSASYQWSVPRHTIAYVLATGRLREYFTNGALRSCMEYAIASHDSQGNEATHGDAWQPFGSWAASLFASATAHYKDPRYKWMLDRIVGGRAPGMWQKAIAMVPAAPTDHVGLRVFTVHPARVKSYGIESIPPERVLDKAVFRSGWEPEAEYMMLDGLNVGNHKHLDANAIIRFSTNCRYWLVDMDYIRSAPKHHNSIAVVRDGAAPDQSPASNRDASVIASPPFAAELIHAAELPNCALTQSLLADYGGLDWRRSIFWKAKDFFVVIDRLHARSAGDYIARCFWRTLGEARLEGSTLHVKQKGQYRVGNEFLEVINDEGRRVVDFQTIAASIMFQQELEPGTYAVEVIAKVLSGGGDSLWVRLDGGERRAYHLPIGRDGESSETYKKATSGPSIPIAKAGQHRFEISLREGPGVCMDKMILTSESGKRITIEAEDMVKDQVKIIDEPEQHFFIVNGDGSRLKLRESFDYGAGGRDGYYERYPFADKITTIVVQAKSRRLRKGEGFTFANLFYTRGGDTGKARELRQINQNAWFVTGESPALLGFGPQRLDALEIDGGMFILTKNRLMTAGAKRVVPEPTTLEPAWASSLLNKLIKESRPALPPGKIPVPQTGDIAKLWQQDLQSPATALAAGAGGILCGTKGGKVVLVSRNGKTIWQKDLRSRVRTVAFAKFAGDREVCLVGTHSGDANALDAAAGKELWNYKCLPYNGRTGSVATIFPADLDGDGGHEVVAGSDNSHYHALSSEGKLLWRTETVHASTIGCAGDCNGDGRDDVAAGTEYYWPRLLDSSGKRIGRLSGGPVTSAVAIFDVDGDGTREAFFGMEDCFVRCVGSTGRALWKANVGGSPTAIEPLDVDGDGKSEIVCSSESFSIYAFQSEGTQIWRTQLPEVVNDLAVVGDRIAAACDDGRVYLLDRRGKLLGACNVGFRPTCLACSGKDVVVAAAGRALVALDKDG